MSMNDSTFDSFAPVVGRGFVEQRCATTGATANALSSRSCADTCVHTDSAVLTDGRYTRSHKISPCHATLCAAPLRATPCHAAAHDRHNTRRLLIIGRHDARKTSIILKIKKKSHESIVTAEKVIRFLRAVVRQRPQFSTGNQPRYVKMHKNNSDILPLTSFSFK